MCFVSWQHMVRLLVIPFDGVWLVGVFFSFRFQLISIMHDGSIKKSDLIVEPIGHFHWYVHCCFDFVG